MIINESKKSLLSHILRSSRSTCIINGTSDLEEIFRVKDFPVYIGTTDKERSEDLENDLIFEISRSSGMIQIKELMPLEIVYGKYHCEAIGPTWKRHHEEFVNFLRKFPIRRIIEIGGSNAYMAKAYLQAAQDSHWCIIEPTPLDKNVAIDRLKIIEGFFCRESIDECWGCDPDVVVHSHAFEHMYDPEDFVKLISQNLNIGDYHVFAVPYLKKYFENRYSNVLNFEHTFYLSEQFIEYLLDKYGFEIIEKKYFEEHSIFYSTIKKKTESSNMLCKNYYEENKSMLLDYERYFNALIAILNEKLIDREFYLFGAHVFSQFLIKKGLISDKIINILDNSVIKNGQRLYGTDITCLLPQVIEDKEDPIVVVFAGGYQKEIEEQLRSINPDVTIINPENYSQ